MTATNRRISHAVTDGISVDADDRFDRLMEVLIEIRDEIRSQGADRQASHGRYETLLRALEHTLDAIDLPFSSHEVETECKRDHDLASAFLAVGVATDAPSIGASFRKLRDRRIGPYILRRDGPNWRLERTDGT